MHFLWQFILSVALALTATVPSFGQSRPTATTRFRCGTPPAVQSIQMYDTSRSFASLLKKAVYFSVQGVSRQRPDRLTLMRFDSHTYTFSDREDPPTGETLLRETWSQLKDPGKEPGTYPALLFQQLVKTVSESDAKSITLYIYTDGGNEGPANSDAVILRCAGKLAADPRVRKVVVIGVLREVRTRWDACLAPLKGRAVILGSQEVTERNILRQYAR